jgi:hypothetical protein
MYKLIVHCKNDGWWFMVFNATFNNILAISWRSFLLVGETGVSGENHRPVASHWQTLSHVKITNEIAAIILLLKQSNRKHEYTNIMYAINSECINILHKICKLMKRGVGVVFVATFNNISVKSCRSVLFVEKTEDPRRKPSTCRTSLTNHTT